MKPPAFQFYADDFIAGVADMTQNEVGAYIMLLAHGWNTHGLKADDLDRLKILAKGDISKHVFGKFKLKNGKLFNPRQEKERKKQVEFRLKQRGNGSKGGRPKKKPTENPSLLSGETQTEAKKSSPSPISSLLSPDIKEDIDIGMEIFEKVESRTSVLFNRPVGTVYSYAEQSAISEISRRPDVLTELVEIETFHEKSENFFPQSLQKLLSTWQETLDRARTHETRKTKNAIHRPTAPDRNAGTFNAKPLSDAAKSKIR